MDSRQFLAALQHADSFFPNGAASFSWGIEALAADGLIRQPADVDSFIVGQLRHRWATSDRPVVAAAHAAGDDLRVVIAVDKLQQAMTLADEFRQGSRRMGRALLGVHAHLGTRNATAYREAVQKDLAPGHLTVVQGLVWRGIGLGAGEALAVAAHGFVVGLLSAALRLGLIGHVGCQRSIATLHGLIADVLASPVPGLEEISSFVPASDIALMRHETQSSRLFGN